MPVGIYLSYQLLIFLRIGVAHPAAAHQTLARDLPGSRWPRWQRTAELAVHSVYSASATDSLSLSDHYCASGFDRGGAFLSGRKTLGSVHWSRDWKYAMFAEALGTVANLMVGRIPLLSPSAQLVVYRLRDGASMPVHFFDEGDDRGFYWIQDYRTFCRHATAPDSAASTGGVVIAVSRIGGDVRQATALVTTSVPNNDVGSRVEMAARRPRVIR